MTTNKTTTNAVNSTSQVFDAVPCLMISDSHLGAEVSPGPAGNRFNLQIGFTRLVETFDKFKSLMVCQENAQRPFLSAQVILGGDMVEGFLKYRQKYLVENEVVLTDETLVSLCVAAFKEQLEGLRHVEGLVKGGLSAVHIVCVSGNHGEIRDMDFKRRDSFENLDSKFYRLLSEACDKITRDSNEEFTVSLDFNAKVNPQSGSFDFEDEYLFFKILDTPFVLRHGATLSCNKGLTSRRGVLSRTALEISARDSRDKLVNNLFKHKKRYRKDHWMNTQDWMDLVLLFGHYHTPVIDSDGKILGCGSLRGPDTYSQNDFNMDWAWPSSLFWVVKYGEGVVSAQEIMVDAEIARQEVPDGLAPYTRLSFENLVSIGMAKHETLLNRA